MIKALRRRRPLPLLFAVMLAAGALIAACSDVIAPEGHRGIDPFDTEPSLNWACTTSWTYADGSTMMSCEYYEEDGGGGSGSFEPPPDWEYSEPPADDCAYYGTCEPQYDPCAENPEACYGSEPPPAQQEASPPAAPDDYEAPPAEPDCNAVRANPGGYDKYSNAYCSGGPPAVNSDRWNRIYNALDAMWDLGGVCQALANRGFELLSAGRIHIFQTSNTFDFSGGAPAGGDWMVVGSKFTDQYYDNSTKTNWWNDWGGYPRNLQHTLAHELDHLLYSHVHLPNDDYNTPNSRACDGL